MQSNHFTPTPVQGLPRYDGQPPSHATDTQTYVQYMHSVQTQISCCKEMHDVLLECARNMEVTSPAMPHNLVVGGNTMKPS